MSGVRGTSLRFSLLMLKSIMNVVGFWALMFVHAAWGEVLLHCTFDNGSAIKEPDRVPAETAGKPMRLKTSGSGVILFEAGKFGKAVRLHGDLKNHELIVINPCCIDFSGSGRMDFWIKFNLYRVKFPAACGESALCGWVFDTPLLAAG
ncbi:MAG: hypothetical protein RDU59_04090 [Thermodesulfobacteriota bacterium]|nr:hypothetical protein [Thermodesulfobacteriota bacterium]